MRIMQRGCVKRQKYIIYCCVPERRIIDVTDRFEKAVFCSCIVIAITSVIEGAVLV